MANEELFEKLFHDEAYGTLKTIFSSLFDEAKNGVLIVTKDGITIYTNPAYGYITGTEPHSRLGTNIMVLDPNCPIAQTLHSGKPMRNFRFKLCDANNELIANTSPIHGASGKLLGAISLFQDIDEINRLYSVLQKKESDIRSLKDKLHSISSAKYDFDDIVGTSPALTKAIKTAREVARTDVTVLIQGESGVGKEMFAHSIHANSRRSRAPFIRINCAAIPDNLIESELFGYEKGAFTGATQQKTGMFELANHGTILLDEIGDMSVQVQTRLLRILEEREFYRVGGQRPVQLDIRVIAATNRDLHKAIEEGKFREDLFYRINIFNVDIPPLRERGEDVVLLAQHFLERYARKMDKVIYGITDVGKGLLMNYDWPGNIRELRNVIERATVVCHDDMLSEKELGYLAPEQEIKEVDDKIIPLNEMEKQAIQRGLALYGSSMAGKQQIAKALGISFRTLYNRLKEYQLDGGTEKEG